MIYQTDTVLNAHYPSMEPTGCASLLPFWTAARVNGLYVDRGLIVRYLDEWLANGWVTAEFYISYWKEIHLSLGLVVRYHGHVSPRTELLPNQFAYGYWYHPENGYHHFTALNDDLGVSYDPLGDSKIVAEGVIESLRLFTLL